MTIDEIADRLYGLPPGEFTAARNAAAKELTSAGDRDGAAEVRALRRPSQGAAAVNRLVRDHRDGVDDYLRATKLLRDAQLAGRGDLAAATAAQRAALAHLVRAGGEAVRGSLQAAAVDADAARELLGGRLVHELEPRGFGTLADDAPPRRPAPASRGRKAQQKPPPAPRTPKPKPDLGPARARVASARAQLLEAKAAERETAKAWSQAKATLTRAEATVARAQAELERLAAQ